MPTASSLSSQTFKFDPERSLGYVINRLARDYARAIGREIAPLGVQPAYLPILFALWSTDGRSQLDLAREADIEPSTMAATLARMTRDGLVTKTRDPIDGRLTRVLLTEQGLACRTPITEAAARVNNRSLEAMSAATPEALLTAIGQLTRALR